MKKALSFLLALFLLTSLFASCGEKNELQTPVTAEENSPVSEAGSPDAGETEPETEARLLPDIPDTTYGGQSFRFQGGRNSLQ